MTTRNLRSHSGSHSNAIGASGRGFSLIELMVSIVVLMVVMGALMQFMSMMQQRYTREKRVASANQTGKTVLELLAMDIGQAGYIPGLDTGTAATPITANTNPQNVTLLNTTGIYAGRVLIVDTGISREYVRVISVTGLTVNEQFKLDHAASVPVRASEVPYPEGILYSTAVPAISSNSNRLRIMGDLWQDASLRYVEYRYTAGANCTGVLVRSDSSAFAVSQTAAVTVAENLCNNASGTPPTPVFSYPTPIPLGLFEYVDEVVVNLIMRTPQDIGPGGGPRTIVMQQTLTPRNVMYALRIAQDGLQDLLPIRPATVPVP